ncbi:MAG TPA: dihydrodipicolinate synthase family protein [Bryobacteraceae bacterium]|nr:dihydrodipicolinate synthase family protein [Bryobacteraceae bacterium]
MPELMLPLEGGLASCRIERACPYRPPTKPLASRIAYAAAHVVPNVGGIDWDATLAYRRYLWSYGLGVAEAMDTAQRGMGLSWNTARELIARSLADAQATGALIACGAGTDQLPEDQPARIDEIIAAYEEQCEWIESRGGRVILMASRALARAAASADDYVDVYSRILSQLRRPAILHWLGDMFDPKLAGYWGSTDLDRAMDTCLGLIHDHATRLDGIKISQLDAQREIDMRRKLPAGVRMYTGDDFNYDVLILGDGRHYSDALLGIFDAIAPAASAAIQALDAGRVGEFESILAPTIPLSRLIFEAPTYLYKTGIVFLAWLNGHQERFQMVGGMETARDIEHLSKLLVLAERAGVLQDPELACARMQTLLTGVSV